MRAPVDIFRPTTPKPLPFPPIGCIPQPPKPPILTPVTPGLNLKDEILFTLKDVNGDEKLSKTEYAGKPGTRYMNVEKAKEFDRYDKDDDGQLSRDELRDGRKWDAILEAFGDRDWFPKKAVAIEGKAE